MLIYFFHYSSQCPSADAESFQSFVPPPESKTFQCEEPSRHVMCNCCEKPMPDRRTDITCRPQTCQVCSLEFCNLYWENGCQNGPCSKTCLKLLGNIALTPLVTGEITPDFSMVLYGNVEETSRLSTYLIRNNITENELRETLLNGLQTGKYTTKIRTMLGQIPKRTTPMCSFCHLSVVQDLLFSFCREIRDESADSRPNCIHGRYCLSQSNVQSPDSNHAVAVNHICDPNPPGLVIDCSDFQFTSVEKVEREEDLLRAKQYDASCMDLD